MKKMLLVAAALVVAVAPAKAEGLGLEIPDLRDLKRPTISFTYTEVNGGKTLIAVPRGTWERYAYPDLRNEVRRQWHAANPRRMLLDCRYQRMVVGEIACDIVNR